jgi:hypothetical protein
MKLIFLNACSKNRRWPQAEGSDRGWNRGISGGWVGRAVGIDSLGWKWTGRLLFFRHVVTLAVLVLAMALEAQTNEPVRLALVPETDELASACDVLTAQLSTSGKVQLLERAEVEKVYREQGLSAAHRDDLKLGRILGADGLLLLDVLRTPQATNLTARLVAVKPGVILTEGSFPWPLKDAALWSDAATAYLDAFLPKLTLLPKDTIPISVVNLRSAIASTDASETERQLKLLTIQRLSQERQLFVLERQKMQLLGEEKELKSNESAFWNGSYLLEGVVDQSGYVKDTITVDVRLTPPKGGAPMQFQVSDSRTNLAELIDRLASKVTGLLQVKSSAPAWNTAEEASQYYNEAKWALRWGVYSEAQAAADSAWALGKRDLDCALVRVAAYLQELSATVATYQYGESMLGPSGYDANNHPVGPLPTDGDVQQETSRIAAENPFGTVFEIRTINGAKIINYAFADRAPDPKNIGRAINALQLYNEFSRTSPDASLKVASETSGWKNSAWYDLGIEDLTAASRTLQNFNFVPESQKQVADKLADLRAVTRSVAEWISQSPPVHDSYFVGDRVATRDELANTIGGEDGVQNVFSCQLKWGSLWQERPEEGIGLYRELMCSPAFCCLHHDFWFREIQMPRLVGWDDEARQRIPEVWESFVQELAGSTNIFWQLEAKALDLVDVDNEAEMGNTFTNFFTIFFENRDTLIANPVEVLSGDWGTGDLIEHLYGGFSSDVKDALQHLYYSEYSPKIQAMDKEYWTKTVTAGQVSAAFNQQRQYLKENRPFDFFTFVTLFQSHDYTRSQALELAPLIAAYQSNLEAQSQSASGSKKGQLMGAIAQVGFLKDDVGRILNPPSPSPSRPSMEAPKPVLKATVVAAVPVAPPAPEVVTNVIQVNNAFTIPVERLISLASSERIDPLSTVTVTAHHLLEGKLVLDFQYDLMIDMLADNGLMGMRSISGSAIALFDLATKHWEVVGYPSADIRSQNNYYHRTTLFNGRLYNCDGGEIRTYDFATQQWQTLKISDGNNYELFTVNGHVYGANGSTLFEIVGDGNETRILASTRRQPPVSVLDSQGLGTPFLFEGPGHSLRVIAGSKIYSFMSGDWREDFAVPPAMWASEIPAEGVFFRQKPGGMSQPISLLFLPISGGQTELCMRQNAAPQWTGSPFGALAAPSPKPRWRIPANLFLANLPATVHQSDLYLLVDHAQPQNIYGSPQSGGGIVGTKYLPKDGYHAMLLAFSGSQPTPRRVYLRFDAPDSCQPLTGMDPNTPQWMPVSPPVWMQFAGDWLGIGMEMPRESMGYGGRPQRTDVGGKASVWLVPVSQIEAARNSSPPHSGQAPAMPKVAM